jgi:hypothetical protein
MTASLPLIISASLALIMTTSLAPVAVAGRSF